MSGVFLRHGNALVRMRLAPYEAESVLQELLEQHPEVLAGEDDGGPHGSWLLVRREADLRLGDEGSTRGFLDHLFVDADGVPTLVEVKRSSDTRIRREVVGQMLDYAANAGTDWNAERLRAWFEQGCRARDEDPEIVLQAMLDDGTADDFWAKVRINLEAERLRLVFVADEIPSQLRRIIEYLNGQMKETEVLAIEVKQYVDDSGTQQMIVPRIIGQTEVARATKGKSVAKHWDRTSILAALTARDAAEADVARRLFAWADARGDLDEGFGRGTKDGSWQAGYWQPRYLWPFVLYTYGRIEIQFQHIAKRLPFDDRGLRDTTPGSTDASARAARGLALCTIPCRRARPSTCSSPGPSDGAPIPSASCWSGASSIR